jgi:hypothetical protein
MDYQNLKQGDRILQCNCSASGNSREGGEGGGWPLIIVAVDAFLSAGPSSKLRIVQQMRLSRTCRCLILLSVLQAEQVGHPFYVFKDLDLAVKVLYKREDRGYGVIIPK